MKTVLSVDVAKNKSMIMLMNNDGEILIDTKEIKHNLEDFEKVKAEIKEIETEVNNMAELGYNLYPRNSNDEIYDIDNITEFFIGEDNALYVIFAYGNQNNTSEMDIVVL